MSIINVLVIVLVSVVVAGVVVFSVSILVQVRLVYLERAAKISWAEEKKRLSFVLKDLTELEYRTDDIREGVTNTVRHTLFLMERGLGTDAEQISLRQNIKPMCMPGQGLH